MRMMMVYMTPAKQKQLFPLLLLFFDFRRPRLRPERLSLYFIFPFHRQPSRRLALCPASQRQHQVDNLARIEFVVLDRLVVRPAYQRQVIPRSMPLIRPIPAPPTRSFDQICE
jgi:hypothetical protein